MRAFFYQIIFFGLFLIDHSCFGSSLNINQLEYGRTNLGEPLKVYKIFKKLQRNSQAIIITGGVHGNEYMGLLDGIINSVRNANLGKGFERFLSGGGVLFIIPKVNPDGVKIKSRYLSNGKDLNRAFVSGTKYEGEASSLVSFINKQIKKFSYKLVFAMDYHCCAGAVLTANQSKFQKLYKRLDVFLKETIDSRYITSTTEKVFGKKFQGTLKDYLANHYQIPAVTYEGLHPHTEISKLQGHMKFWDKLLGHFASESMFAHKTLYAERKSIGNNTNSLSTKSHSE